jgi:TfoX/Sxy family transcriptional regulator of competence genes
MPPDTVGPPFDQPSATAGGVARARAEASPDPARQLLDRVEHAFPHERLREVRMFGVTAVMADDAMAVAVHRDGSLLLRVDPAEDAALLERPHASRAEMGTGRSMGEGWIRVGARAVETDQGLSDWLQPVIRFLGPAGA